METLIFIFDTIAVMVVIYFSYKGEKAPGKPELGPFAIRTAKVEAPAAATTALGPRPVRRR